MVIKIFRTELGKRIDLNTAHLNKELENTGKIWSEIVNSVFDIKWSIDTEEWISDITSS